MIWATLGDLRFELLRAPESADLAIGHTYAEHAVIEGKPKLQWTGDALRERNWTIRLHHSFCDPDTVMTALRTAAAGHQALPLSLGTGTYLGRYVIVDISEETLFTGPTGRTMELAATLKLKEWAGEESKGVGEAVTGIAQRLIGSVWR